MIIHVSLTPPNLRVHAYRSVCVCVCARARERTRHVTGFCRQGHTTRRFSLLAFRLARCAFAARKKSVALLESNTKV